MFVNFLVNLLHLEEFDGTCDYVVWYEGAGAILGIIIPIITSLMFVVLFYYVWSKYKATNTGHWILAGFVNILVAFFLDLFIGRASLANFISELGDEYQDLWYNVATWPFTTDLWVFAVNGAIWCIILYFIFSLILKRWSPVFNIPFGRKYKKAVN